MKLICTRDEDAEIKELYLSFTYQCVETTFQLETEDIMDLYHADEPLVIKLNFTQDWNGCLSTKEILLASGFLSAQLMLASFLDERHLATIEDYSDDGEQFWEIHLNDEFSEALGDAYGMLEDQQNLYEFEIEI